MRRTGIRAGAAIALAAALGGCSLILDFGGGDEEAADVDGAPVADAETVADGPPAPPVDARVDPVAGTPRSCAAAHAADPRAPSGVYRLDPDGDDGPLAARDAYCEMTLAEGGWELISVIPPETAVPIMGVAVCLDPVAACTGHLSAEQATRSTEILIQDLSAGEHLILSGFAADASSALRYWTRELALTTSEVCTAPHVCNVALDPDLALRTSGYAMVYTPPLQQWWRQGGWWIGAGATPGSAAGNVFRTSYAGVNWLSTRAVADGASTVRAQGTQRVFARVPAL